MRHGSTSVLLLCISICLPCAAWGTSVAASDHAQGLTSNDLSRLRSIGSVALSPDGHYIAYTITMRDRPGRPYGQLWVMDLGTEKSMRLGGDKPASGPVWSGDSKWIAFHGADGDKHGLFIAHPDGSDTTFLAAMAGTNSPLPGTGEGRRVVARRKADRVRFVDSRAKARPKRRRSHGDHALSL